MFMQKACFGCGKQGAIGTQFKALVEKKSNSRLTVANSGFVLALHPCFIYNVSFLFINVSVLCTDQILGLHTDRQTELI